MRVLLLIVLLFVQQGWATEVEPLTDWQVYQLKEQVKKMAVIRISENGNIEREEIEFDRQGYKTVKKIFRNNTGINSVSAEMKFFSKERYMPYNNNKRWVLTGDEEDVEVELSNMNRTNEYWFADGQHITINMGPTHEVYVKEIYSNENKLLSQETKISIKWDDSEYNSISKNLFTYDKEGELIRTDIKASVDEIETEGYQIFEVQKRDKQGNIILRTVENYTEEPSYKESFTYEYYN
ncbi:MAG: hypothetical protein LBI73_00470 [Myroides sp.]|jgi:hypothetical protein|nr:hypothetical protein [Myroides sp.]